MSSASRKFLFFDDSKQKACKRPKMRPMTGVGGIVLDSEAISPLAKEIDVLCESLGFPSGEPFKWSPGKNLWMRENLQDDVRENFFACVLQAAAKHGATALAVFSEAGSALATAQADTREQDAVYMLLERFHGSLGYKELGFAVAARPSGGRGDEDNFLRACETVRKAGTDYTKLERIPLNVLTMQASETRLLQIADLVVSITCAMISGNEKFASSLWPSVRKLFRSEMGRRGGVGLKIHPDFTYANLYHWLLADEHFWRFNSGFPLPLQGRPFAKSLEER